MFNLKNLLAVALLCSVSALSFAKAPVTPKHGAHHATVVKHKHTGQVAKHKHLKTKAHAKKHAKVHLAKKHHKAVHKA